MAFQDHQLEEIRNRLKVSAVVGARFPLVKKGVEFVAKDNESFTVNDKKAFWCEFGKDGDGKPHDIFDFLQTYEGYTFVGAVEELARQAGVTLESRPGRSLGSSDRSQNAHQATNGFDRSHAPGSARNGEDRSDAVVGDSDEPQQQARGRKEIITAWDYIDPENVLLYQVVRMQERMPDGSWKKN